MDRSGTQNVHKQKQNKNKKKVKKRNQLVFLQRLHMQNFKSLYHLFLSKDPFKINKQIILNRKKSNRKAISRPNINKITEWYIINKQSNKGSLIYKKNK